VAELIRLIRCEFDEGRFPQTDDVFMLSLSVFYELGGTCLSSDALMGNAFMGQVYLSCVNTASDWPAENQSKREPLSNAPCFNGLTKD